MTEDELRKECEPIYGERINTWVIRCARTLVEYVIQKVKEHEPRRPD